SGTTNRPRSSVTTLLISLVGVECVSAITHTPASGPCAPVTTPPMSSLSIAGAAPAWPDMRTELVAKNTMTAKPRSNADSLFLMPVSLFLFRGMDPYSTGAVVPSPLPHGILTARQFVFDGLPGVVSPSADAGYQECSMASSACRLSRSRKFRDRAIVRLAPQHVRRREAGGAAVDDHHRCGSAGGRRTRRAGIDLGVGPGELLTHEDDITRALDPPAGNRIERRRAHRLAGTQAETGVMPWTPQGAVGSDAVGQRPVIVRAVGAPNVAVETRLWGTGRIIRPLCGRPP